MRGPRLAAQEAWSSAMAAGLILFVGLTAWAASEPWLFPSLGPTAYLLASYPDLPTSRPYNCLVGHFVGIVSGFAAVAVFNAWDSPVVPLNDVSLPRLGAATLAIGLTVLLSYLLRCGHPPAAATTLLISLGALDKAWGPALIVVGVVLLVATGEGIKRLRRRYAAAAANRPGGT